MNKDIAVLLVKSLLERIERDDERSGRLEGRISASEIEALRLLAGISGSESPAAEAPAGPMPEPSSEEMEEPSASVVSDGNEEGGITLDLSSADGEPDEDVRICIDFGTAMSKATLVLDSSAGQGEQIEVLKLGIPGDQQEISQTMLVSSVLIDSAGRLWFGQEAVERSMDDALSGGASRIDNIKRRISEGGWGDEVSDEFNPSGIRVTYEDLIIAYLTYLTFCINNCLEELGYDGRVLRRYASPCLDPERTAKVETFMQEALVIAQIVVDTVGDELCDGFPLDRFAELVTTIRNKGVSARFVGKRISEPAGVMGATISWESNVNGLFMVVDVGAGTTDFGLFRVVFDPEREGVSSVFTVEDTPRAIRAAGNHLDRILRQYAISKGGVENRVDVRRRLDREIRELKETLFNEGKVHVVLSEDEDIDVHIELDEFLALTPVKKFSEQLRETMEKVFLQDPAWVNWFSEHLEQKLVVILTGGGSELPMVRELTSRDLTIDGRTIPVARSLEFPSWLQNAHPGYAEDFSRIAVSLGGARNRFFGREGRIQSAPIGEREQFTIGRY